MVDHHQLLHLLTIIAGGDILLLQIEGRGQEKEEAEHKTGQDKEEGSGLLILLVQPAKEE